MISENNVFGKLVFKINADAVLWVPPWDCFMDGLIQSGLLEGGGIYSVHFY